MHASTDDSVAAIQAALGDKGRLLQNEINRGVAQTRNAGLLAARGQFALALDADDKLAPDALTLLAAHLIQDPYLGIAFSRLAFLDSGQLSDWLSLPFDYNQQVAGKFNQIPTCCLFRRKDALRVGGYRTYMQPSEDADLFTRLVTFTGKRAARVSDAPLFLYRTGHASLRSKLRRDPYTERGLPMWGKQRPLAAPSASRLPSNPVMCYDHPLIKVDIIGDGDYLTTLDSLYEQTFWNWSLEVDAPLVVRVEAGKWLPASFLAEGVKDGTFEKDNGHTLYKVQKMACCGNVQKGVPMTQENMLKVRWVIDTHDNPIPSFTGQRDVTGQIAIYRGNRGGELYVFKADYEKSLSANKNCWELVPEQVILEVQDLFVPAPEPPKLLIPIELPEPQADFAVLENDAPKRRRRARNVGT